jgi:hypothetical protein
VDCGSVLIVELSALAVAVVALLLERLDRHKDEVRQRPEVAEALVSLHRVISGWATAARDVNAVYQDWVDRGAHGPVDDFDAFTAQTAYVKVFEDLLGGFGAEHNEKPTPALGVLEIYAPELKEDLRRVSAERLEQYAAVYTLMQDYAASVTAPDAQKLESTAADLERAAEALRRFIVNTFPAHDA